MLRDTRIRNDVDIFAFYTMHRLELNGVIETRAAIAAGEAVRDEVHRSTTELRPSSRGVKVTLRRLIAHSSSTCIRRDE